MIKQKGDTEIYIQWYFEELKERGYVESIDLNPSPIQLKSEFVTKGRHFNPMEYTPDILVNWSKDAECWFNAENITWIQDDFKRPFVSHIIGGYPEHVFYRSYIEIKPDVNKMFMQDSTSAISFPYRQRLVFVEKGIYVQLVKPIKLFTATFTPQRYLTTDKSLTRKRKLHHFARSLDDYLRLTDNLTKPLPISKDDRGEFRLLEDAGINFIED